MGKFEGGRPQKARPFSKRRDNWILDPENEIKVAGEVKRHGHWFFMTPDMSYSSTWHRHNLQYFQSKLLVDCLLVGEIAYPDFEHTAPDVSHALAEGWYHKLKYFAFDILEYKGEDLRGWDFIDRRAVLERMFPTDGSDGEIFDDNTVLLNEIWYENHKEKVEHYKELGAEGVMFKYLNKPYKEGSRCNFIKLKYTDDYDVVIVDVEGKPSQWTVRPGEYGKDGIFYPDGKLTESWRLGYGNLRYGLFDHKTGDLKIIGSLGVTGPKDTLRKFVGKVACVKGWGQFKTGAIEHPQVKYYRDPTDKRAEDCLWDFENGVQVLR